MPDRSPPVGVAVLAGGRAEMLRASLNAHADALDALEAAGSPTCAVVVDATDRPDAAAVVAALDGATVLGGDPAEPEAAALARAVAALPGTVEHVVLTATDAAPGATALATLLEAARGGADLVLADPADPAPYALARRAALARLADLPPGEPPVAALARDLRAAGRTVALAAGAGVLRGDTSEVVTPGDARGAVLDTGHPEAVRMGYATYLGPRSVVTTWGPLERIEIGAYCSIAGDVRIFHPGGTMLDANGDRVDTTRIRGAHRMGTASTFPIGILVPDEPYDDVPPDAVAAKPMRIGSDVWIGAGAVVMGEVTVGHGAVIGAGAVVRRDVAPYEIVVGNPQVVKRRRFDDATCERLLNVRWWDWDPAIVRGNHTRFAAPIDAFVARFDPAGELA
ncbi:MAG TPA: CatB-related O-acetyltransferase [Capillimicrobium sp.]|nr:CatB-related O-acetyltransferase [Capillimicrobium sp.]